MKILLLEDELMLKTSIMEYLEALGHICTTFAKGDEAKISLQSQSFDLLILDINVPNLTGLELLENMNCLNNFTPTIFISALTDIDNISKAFNLGACDYIKKPFHLKELALRVQKISNDIEQSQNQHIVLSKNYSYSKENKVLFFNKQPQPLTKKQLDIMSCLCNNAGSTIGMEVLREYVWNFEPVSDGTIRAEIARLRKVLKDDIVVNYKGIGYKIDKFIA